jgi:hypothetical protein
MEPKGNVWIKNEFTATTIWPNPQFNFLTGEEIDLEKEYKEALAGKLVVVMDIAVDGSGYLVLGKTKQGGDFIWMIEKEDTRGFIPVIKKNGILMPAGLSPIEEFKYMAEHYARMSENFKNKE